MNAQQQLVRLLADGKLHSGNEMAHLLGVSRTAVWKQLSQLNSLNLNVSAQAGQGYRLAEPLELLDADEIWSAMGANAQRICGRPELFWTTESTSSLLLSRPAPEAGKAHACLAEFQTAGRGRRGRPWFAPAGHGICLSVAWRFESTPASLSCLGLAVGVGVMRALQAVGVGAAQIKWPNDIVLDGRKLAGILIDVQGESGGPLHVVAGIGVNYRLSAQMREAVVAAGGLLPACIDEVEGATRGRNRVAAALIDELCRSFCDFTKAGFEPLVGAWEASDYLHGRAVSVRTDSGELTGTARGITGDGRLRLEANGRELLLVTGDVSIRAAS